MHVTTQLVVLGPHRSGTSAVTGLLARMGAYVGAPEQNLPRDATNPKGFHERVDVVAINDALLACGAAPQWSTFRPGDADDAARALFEARARPVAGELAAHQVSVLKDPRMCLTFGLWRPLLPNPVCLLALRNPMEVAHSLRERDGCPLVVGVAVWEHHMRQALTASEGLPRYLVDYAELVADAGGCTARLAAQLRAQGIEGLDPGRAQGWIEPVLRHFQMERNVLDEVLNPAQLAFYRTLCDGTALTAGSGGRLSSGAEDALLQSRAILQVVAALRVQETRLRREVDALHVRDAHLAQLDAAIRELLDSWRWRFGNGVVDVLRAALLRPDVPQPKDVILRLLEELERVRTESGRSHGI